MTYPVAIGVIECLQFDDVRMSNNPHDLELSVLFELVSEAKSSKWIGVPHLESPVLQHPLDGCILAAGLELGLEDDAERSVADDLTLSVLHLPSFTCDSILYLFLDGFYDLVSKGFLSRQTFRIDGSPPILRLLRACVRLCDIFVYYPEDGVGWRGGPPESGVGRRAEGRRSGRAFTVRDRNRKAI